MDAQAAGGDVRGRRRREALAVAWGDVLELVDDAGGDDVAVSLEGAALGDVMVGGHLGSQLALGEAAVAVGDVEAPALALVSGAHGHEPLVGAGHFLRGSGRAGQGKSVYSIPHYVFLFLPVCSDRRRGGLPPGACSLQRGVVRHPGRKRKT